jgi:hypothetical protein
MGFGPAVCLQLFDDLLQAWIVIRIGQFQINILELLLLHIINELTSECI